MLHSLNPKAMWHTAELMWEIMRGESRLSTAQREMIATVTSATLNCRSEPSPTQSFCGKRAATT